MLRKTIFVFAAVLILAAELKACPDCCSSYGGSSLVNCIKPFIPRLGLKNLLLSRLLRSVVRCRKNPLLLGGLRYPYGGCQSPCSPYGTGIEYERSSSLVSGPAALTPTLTSTIASPYASYLGTGGYSSGGLCASGLGSDCCCGNALCGGGTCAGCGGACSECGGLGETCGGCGGLGGTCGGCGGLGGTCGGCGGLGGTCGGCGGTCAGCGGACSGCDGACLGPCGGCRDSCDDLCCGKRGSLFSGKMRTKCFEGGFSLGGC